MLKTAAQLRDDLKEWLLKKNPGMKPGDFDEKTHLLKKGIIDSLRLMDLVLMVEKLCGHPLDLENLSPAVFESIETISSRFFEVMP